MNGLVRRLEALELAATTHEHTRNAVGEIIMAKVFEMAQRFQVTPPKPVEQQSPFERIIRAALADTEQIEDGQERARAFWQGFCDRGRAFVREHSR
jgi:hypothetical protein